VHFAAAAESPLYFVFVVVVARFPSSPERTKQFVKQILDSRKRVFVSRKSRQITGKAQKIPQYSIAKGWPMRGEPGGELANGWPLPYNQDFA
jgi:hypothetical protein